MKFLLLILGQIIQPKDLQSFLCISPSLASSLPRARITFVGDSGETILHLLARQDGGPRLLAALLANLTTDSDIHDLSRNKVIFPSYMTYYPSDWDLYTPLSAVAYHGNHAAVKLLLAHGSSVFNPPSPTTTYNDRLALPLSLAVHNGQLSTVTELLAYPSINPNYPEFDGLTPLAVAAQQGQTAIVTTLLAHPGILTTGPNPSTSTSSLPWTPLSAAADRGHAAVVALLLARADVDINHVTGYSPPALYVAAERGRHDVVKLLLAREDIDVRSYQFCTDFGRIASPLMAAARDGHAEVMRLLMERDDVELQVRDSREMSLLGAAAEYGHLDAVRLLLGRGGGVEVDVRDNNGMTPLLLAAWLKESHRVQGRRDELEVARLLLETEGVDVHARDEDGRGVLAQAVGCRKGNMDMVALLLEGGVDVEARDKWGATPLLAAAEWGNTKVVRCCWRGVVWMFTRVISMGWAR